MDYSIGVQGVQDIPEAYEIATTLGTRVESAKKNTTSTKYPHSGVHYEG